MTDAVDGSGQPLPDAHRETRTTRLLRRLRLDELPQLLIIARGDMAFVGPRPLLPGTINAFGDLGLARCAVRPGLTGWAQIHGNTKLGAREKLALDLWYIRHRSVALDLRILLMTARTLIFGERVSDDHVRIAIAALADGYPKSERGIQP